jgi:signal transduction histidine kinase/Fe-S-cluster-containing hydrogenase component 2
MKRYVNTPLVRTIREHCRVCYTCVRECSAKAIRISDGQAQVLPERCIACGNCVRVCSQKAKQVQDSTGDVAALLQSGQPVAACLAPSFPAEFTELAHPVLVGMLRTMGFAVVAEVAFGADLVADRYRRLLNESDGQRYIATTCPAIVAYVERYHPELLPHLAPIVSPMIATARALRRLHGPGLKVVFIGPCIAKKGECASELMSGEVNAALTFVELRRMLAERSMSPQAVSPSEFDAPRGAAGNLLAVSRGLLQASGIHESLLDDMVVSADGRRNFVQAIREFETGDLDARLLEVLACEGCINGAGMSNETALYSRRASIGRHTRRRLAAVDRTQWLRDMEAMADLDLGRAYRADDQRIGTPFREELELILARIGKVRPEDELNCGACGYDTCREHAVAIFKGLAECEMCLPYTIEQLRWTVRELAVSNEQLADTQAALMQSEKLASMGQLAAGVAHEVNNPLGVVLMYAHLLLQETPAGSKLRDDLALIVDQADRCKKIVAGLLHFARQNKLVLAPVDLAQVVDSAMRAVHLPAGVALRVQHDQEALPAELDRDQVVQVLMNLLSNAQAAMPAGGLLSIRTGGDADRAWVEVADTGTGIAPEHMDKIFEPFFTTKPIGKGTGLGLAVSYGIVKMHRGEIKVKSNADPAAGPTGTTFTVWLPRKAPTDA